ncbi:hypothetical protein ScPMuIL_004060 [Solemya velum]
MADETEKSVLQREGEDIEDNVKNSNGLKNNDDEEEYKYFSNGQLNYVGKGAGVIPPELISDYCSVTTRLDLSFNTFSDLEGLEKFINLEELVLDSNMINDSVYIPSLKRLQTLTLNKNQLTNLESLLEQIQNKLPSLTYLSLLGNMACPNQLSCEDKDEEDYQRYRYYVLYCLPNLKFLDSSAVKAKELSEARRVGPYMKIVRPQDKQVGKKDHGNDLTPNIYSPLPNKSRDTEEHIGTFGKSKYVYYGRHSEGNRFIKNTDL